MKTSIVTLFFMFLSGIAPVMATNLSIEDRILETIKKKKDQAEYLENLEFYIKHSEQLTKIDKEFNTQVNLLSFFNITADQFGLPDKLIDIKNGFLLEIKDDIGAVPVNDFVNKLEFTKFEKVLPITTHISIIKKGAVFKIIDYRVPNDYEPPRYIISDKTGKTFEMKSDMFDRVFTNTSIVRDLPVVFQKYEKAISVKTSDYKAMYCAFVTSPKPETSDYHFLQGAEEFDPKLESWISYTDSQFKRAYEKLIKVNNFTYDPFVYTSGVHSFQVKKICYGMYFKDAQSFLNALYFLPVLISGNWKM